MKIELATLRGLDAHEQADEDLKAHLRILETEADGQAMTTEALADFEETVAQRAELEAVIKQLKIRQQAIAEADEAQVERVGQAFPTFNVKRAPENVFDLAAYRQQARNVDELPGLYRDGAMRVLETAIFPTLDDHAKGRNQVSRLLEAHKDENHGEVARRIIGTYDPRYSEAWGEYIRKGSLAALSPARQAILQTYSDANGGFAIPFTLDPTFINTSDGSVNPLRQIARVEQITTKSWQGVTTAGVTASYVGERTTTGASDGAPSDFDNPTVTPLRADVAVDVTAEYLEDYGSSALQSEVGRMVQVAKDDLEADKFVMGGGTTEPDGVVAALITDTTSIVQTATDNTFVLGDIDALVAATPPRFRSRGRFMANLAILQYVTGFGDAGQPGPSIYDAIRSTLRGYPVHEATAMDDTVADAKEILLFGDFKAGFIIVDRIGLSTEVLPRYDASARPTGGRVIYAHWRNSSQLLFPNAFRLLQVK